MKKNDEGNGGTILQAAKKGGPMTIPLHTTSKKEDPLQWCGIYDTLTHKFRARRKRPHWCQKMGFCKALRILALRSFNAANSSSSTPVLNPISVPHFPQKDHARGQVRSPSQASAHGAVPVDGWMDGWIGGVHDRKPPAAHK